MNNCTLPDIRLKEYTLDKMPRLKLLKGQVFKARAEVCIERAEYMTRYLKEMSSETDPMIIRYANALNYFLSNKAPLFFDDNVIAGTTTSKPFGAPVYPEFTGLTIWPELDTISKRKKNPLLLSKTEAEKLNSEIFPYWVEKNILEYTRNKYHNPECMHLFERLVFFIASKAGCISHTVPNYTVALQNGLEYIINDAASRQLALESKKTRTAEEEQSVHFYNAVQITMKGCIRYAERLSEQAALLALKEPDPAKKENLLKMAEICKHVPAKPARTFREAVNALWIVQVAIHAENINMAMSPGRVDQVLYPYFKNDLDNGRLTVSEAIEIAGCFWLKLNDNANLVPETAEELFGGAGTVPAVTLGGVDLEGKDAVNDLTYIMLRVTELLKSRDPNVNARYHYDVNSKEYLERVSEVVANTKAVPAFFNDKINIGVLENQGVSTPHARDYSVIGCVELSASGRSYDASSSILLNLVSVLELALYHGTRPITGTEQIGPDTGDPITFSSFKKFLAAFETQLKWLVGKAIELNEYLGHTHQEIMPTPMLSAFFEGPMEKGKDLVFGGAIYNGSGATHIGFADTVDSLSAIEKAVFIDKKYTMKALIEAVKTNFDGQADMQAYLTNKMPKYGTDDPIAYKNSQYLVRFLYYLYQGHTNYRGGKYKPSYWTMTNHAGQGKLCGALPSGRKANQLFASGITPVSQAAGSLTSCLRAVGELGAKYIPGGQALNLKYPSITGADDVKKFADAVDAYFRYGGMQIQFNIMSYQDLIAARDNPKLYEDLLVRVSGYSAYFKDLNDAMKEEIITRTAYEIKSGKAIPYVK